MFNKFKLAAVIAWMAVVGNAWSFDIATHTAMTSEAIKQSLISASPNTSQTLKKLGLLDRDFAIGSSYVDLGSLVKRDGTEFESRVMDRARIANADIPDAYRIPGWIVRGAVREDDNTKETRQGTPQGDEPNGVFDRVYGHFFDPVNNRGLTIGGKSLGPRAPEWATHVGAVVTGLGFGSRQNYYNWPSAREAMWRALTLKAWNNGTLSDAVDPSNWPYSTKEQLRQAYWATMFRAVGDVVHLVQDMAQPQHTRNDAHSGYGCVAWTGSCSGGHASFFENYLRARTLIERGFRLDEGFLTVVTGSAALQEIVPGKLDYCCYSKPSFSNADEFFSTAIGAGNATGKGLANYSNRGFYSFGTNISSSTSNYPSPPPFGSGLGTATLDGNDLDETKRLKDMAGKVLLGARITLLTGTVMDSLGGGNAASVKLAALGYWDQFLQQEGLLPRYTLNYYNYDDQARLLIPRAVAYSAGLIDYFFRGQMEIFLPAEGVYAIVDHSLTANNCKDNCGFTQVKLKVANSTPDIVVSGGNGAAIPQAMTGSGTLVAVAKYRKNTCYTADLEGEYDSSKAGESTVAYAQRCRSANEEITVSQPLTGTDKFPPPCAGNCEANALPLIFTFNTPIPINATDLHLQVVYRGPLGAEQDAVVVATKDIPEPTYFSLMNTTDYMVCSGGSYFYRNADGTGYPGAPMYPYQTWMAFQPDNGSSVGTAIARIDDLRPKEYVRVAALVDTGRTYARNIAGLAGPDLQLLSAVNTGLNQTNYAANGTATADVFDFRINSFRKVKSHFAFTRVTGSTDCVPASPPAHAYPPEPAYPPHTPPAMRAVTIRPFS